MGIVLTHSAKYKPMSFERLIQPYIMATEEYRTLEKGIADLDAEAESMRQIAQREIDAAQTEGREVKPFAIDYMNYADSLDTKAIELANKGLKGVNRKSLYDLQAQYKTKVKPIEDADKYIKEIAKEQRLLNKSGNIVFDRDFSNGVSIQDVIDNPSLGYNAYNLDDYGKQAILEGTAIKAGMTPTYLGKDPTDQNIFYSQGMSDEDLYNWIAGTPNKELDATVDRIAGNAPQAVKDRVKSDLAKSLRSSISKEANKGYETSAQKYSRIKSNASLTAQMNRNDYTWNKDKNTWELTPLGLQKELLRQDTEYKKLGQTIEKDKDGKYLTNEDGTPKVRFMTKEEKEEYKNLNSRKTTSQNNSKKPTASQIENEKRKKGINFLYDEAGNKKEEPNKYYKISDTNFYKKPLEDSDLPDKILEKKQEIAKMYNVNISNIEVYASDQVDTRTWKKRRVYRFVGAGMRDPYGQLKTQNQVSNSQEFEGIPDKETIEIQEEINYDQTEPT